MNNLPNRLKAQIQQLIAKLMKSLLASPDPPRCSCEQPGNCRIKLMTVVTANRTTYLEPRFRNCNCTPAWRNFHQRQLDFINADLRDMQTQKFQLRALNKGVQQLVDRHREFAKAEIRYEQYWLRQDYARTDNSRWLHNLDIRNEQDKRRRRALLELEGESSADNEIAIQDRKKELSVEAEDLYIDDDVYGFRRCGSDNQASEEGQPESNLQTNTGQQTLKLTLDAIRQGQFLSLEQVHSRFEDLQIQSSCLNPRMGKLRYRACSQAQRHLPAVETA
ncbi:MAG: hypothetical protein Q9213_001999 [Squamulea squamosa]